MRSLIKVVSLIVRRPDLSRERFADHYETVHAPLALAFLEDLHGYTRNHVRELIAGSPTFFDCASEFWYADRAAVARTMQFMASPLSQPLRDDESTFMDKPRNTFFSVAETLVRGDPSIFGDKDACKFMVFQRAPSGTGDADVEEDLDKEIQGMAGLVRCVRNRSLAPAAFACVTELWFRNCEAGERALRRCDIDLRADSVVSVREVETHCGG